VVKLCDLAQPRPILIDSKPTLAASSIPPVSPPGGYKRLVRASPGWTRELGRTGIPTTAIALGLAALGRPGYLTLGHGLDFEDHSVKAMADRSHEVLDAAYRAGVRHFDAARSYGRAEEFLGSWLRSRSIEPGAVTVSSKWGYTYTAGWRVDADPPEVKDLSAETLRRQLEETREQLGPYLRLYQIHSATVSSGVLDDPAVLAELDALRSTGVAVGMSVTGLEQAATIEHAAQSGRFDTVQATWNLLERSAGEALHGAHEAGLGVMVKEALANGRLTARGAIEPLARAARRLGVSEDALALAGVLARPWVDTVLSGASTVDQLESNLAAVNITWDATLEDELAPLAEAPDSYWETRSNLRWT
jgi:aryl-alcohol dehydrogenase-like predicted oxidoreductase